MRALRVVLAATIGLIVCGGLLQGAWAAHAAPAYQAASATLTVLRGTAAVIRPNGAQLSPAPSGMVLGQGDQVSTLAASGALITFFEGSEVELGANATVALRELAVAGTRTTVTLESIVGTTVHRVITFVDPGSSYRVDSGGTVALVRGTVFSHSANFRAVAVYANIVQFPVPGQNLTPGQARQVDNRGRVLTKNFDPGTTNPFEVFETLFAATSNNSDSGGDDETVANNPPVTAGQTVSTNEDSATAITLSGTDADLDPLAFTITSGPSHGTLSGTAPNLTYTPAPNYNGPDSFTYSVSDGKGGSATGTVNLNVVTVNDPPVAADDGGASTAAGDAYSTNKNVPLTVGTPGVLANDSDPDNQPLMAVLVDGPSHGTLGLNPKGGFTYIPAQNYTGTDSFTYRANDGSANSNTAKVTITVVATNAAPVAQNGAIATNEDTAAPVALAATDADGNPLSFSIVAGPAHGTLSGPAPNLTYTPAANYHGPDSFTFKVNDGALDSNVATISITVNTINDAPVAQSQDVGTAEDIPQPIVLAASDVDGQNLNFAIVSQPSHGTLVGNPPHVTYHPTANYTGPDSFSFKANDGVVDSNVATVSISVGAINDAPAAVGQNVATNEDTPVGIQLGGADVDNPRLTFEILSQPGHGTLGGTPPNLTYTPAPNYHGPDSFTFRTGDGSTTSSPATLNITVNPVNDPPVAQGQSVATVEDTPKAIVLQATDLDGDSLTYALVAGPSHGAVSGTGANRTYTPAANYNGPDSFTFKANDGTVDSNVATVSLTVGASNDTPLASNDAYTTNEDTPLTIPAPGVLGNDTDVDANPLTAIKVSDAANGTLTLNANGSFTFTPAANFHGATSFTYKANDGAADSNAATATITVSSVNDPPVAANDSASTNEDTPLTVSAPGVLGNDADVDGDGLSAVLVGGPAHGQLTLNSNGSYSYTPAANYNGPDSFTYKANDGTVDSSPATVNITVGAINDAPVAQGQSVATGEDTPKAIVLQATDTDSNSLTFAIVTPPSHGGLSGAAPNLTYTPAANYNGPDSFTFKANDGTVDSNTATVSISVGAGNDAPLATNDSYSTNEDTPLTVGAPGVLGNDSDIDSNPLTAVLVSGPPASAGTLALNPNGSFTFTPAANFNGATSFSYTANDGTVPSNPPATVNITVNPLNDPPVAQGQSVSTCQGAAKAITLVATDVEGTALTYIIVSEPTKGTLSGSGASRTYTPSPGQTGSDPFTFQAHDGTVPSNVATVSITITAVTVSINDVSEFEGSGGGKKDFNFTVTLSCPASSTVTAHFETEDGTAQAPGDYDAQGGGTVTFNGGSTSETIRIRVDKDSTPEPDETFFVRITRVSGAVEISNPSISGKGTIKNDDVAATQSGPTTNRSVSTTSTPTPRATPTVAPATAPKPTSTKPAAPTPAPRSSPSKPGGGTTNTSPAPKPKPSPVRRSLVSIEDVHAEFATAGCDAALVERLTQAVEESPDDELAATPPCAEEAADDDAPSDDGPVGTTGPDPPDPTPSVEEAVATGEPPGQDGGQQLKLVLPLRADGGDLKVEVVAGDPRANALRQVKVDLELTGG